jgi:hypothetical protein
VSSELSTLNSDLTRDEWELVEEILTDEVDYLAADTRAITELQVILAKIDLILRSL